MNAIQFYAASVLLLILVASLMAINAMEFSDFARIIATCATLIGMYALLFSIFKRHDVSVLGLIGSLVALPLLPSIRYAAYLVGALGWVVLIRHRWQIDKNRFLCLPVLFVVIFGSHIYSDFEYRVSLILGAIHTDTLFHAAIAAMYRHYGVASVGLDGLVPIAYHTLSHKILAGVATLSGFPTLAVYSYLFFAMAPLLLAFSLAGFACQANPALKFSRALLGVAVLMLAIRSVPVFDLAAMWDSYLVSESYLIALVILAASMTTFLSWVEGGGVGLVSLATSLSLLILAGLAKGSVGLVGICVFGLFGITKFRNFKYWLLLAVASALLCFGVIDAAAGARQHSPISPLHFVTAYVMIPFRLPMLVRVGYFLLVHFLTVWACFLVGLRKLGSGYLGTNEFQVLIALTIPALILSLTFEIAGGSAGYSSGIPVIVSLPFLLAGLAHRLGAVKFKHVIGLAILAGLVVSPSIVRKSFLMPRFRSRANIAAVQPVVKQLQYIRDNWPANVLVKIENPEWLVSKIGGSAYWFLPAVMERPLVDGLPHSLGDGFYGLSDYNTSAKKLVSEDFRVVRVELGQE